MRQAHAESMRQHAIELRERSRGALTWVAEHGRYWGGLAADIGGYARARVREREAPAEPAVDPLEVVWRGLSAALDARLVETRKAVSLAITDEKRFALQHQQERANAAEWEKRA